MHSIFRQTSSPVRSIKSLGFVAAVTVACYCPLSAATLANYAFTSDLTSSDTETNSTAGEFLGASGLNPGGSGRAGAGNFFVRSSVTAADQTAAATDNDYAGFTVTIGGGFQAALTTLTFTHTANVGGTDNFSPNFTSNIQVWSSINNFTSSLGSSSLTKAGASTGNTVGSVNIDLSAYAGLTGNIEFRIYVFDDTTRNDDFTRFDDIILSGDLSSVPEPSGLLLASLGLIPLLRRKRF